MKKRRGFTLSELLVVVVIIGVLSAVVLPKFSKVIETRKTTEAEELMSAVRTEQEARCTLSKSYTASKDSLGSYKDGKYFNYDLGTVGMTASATSGKYKLEMPSYADGRICCSEVTEGSKECEKLNKNYPLCSDLIHNTDYVVGNENCEVEIEDGKETPTEPEDSCLAAHDNVAPYIDSEGCTVTTSWELKDYPTCWVSSTSKSNCPEPQECTDGQKKLHTPSEDCWEGCGEVYDVCVSGKWSTACQGKATSACMPWDEPKTETTTKDGKEVTITYSCQSCQWVKTDEKASCPQGKKEVDGICCLPGQKTYKNKCIYDYKPEHFEVNVLVNCHNHSPSTASTGRICSASKRDYGDIKYFIGGSLPSIPATKGVDAHHAYTPPWNGGTEVKFHWAELSWYSSEQEWCDAECGASPSCTYKGLVSEDFSYNCPTYRYDNYSRYACDNSSGTAVGLKCVLR